MRKGASFKNEVLHLFKDSRRGAGIAGAPRRDMERRYVQRKEKEKQDEKDSKKTTRSKKRRGG